MNLNGLKVLIDGINLEELQGTGIKTYATALIRALKELGADPGVLISKYSLKQDKKINTEVLALFQDMSTKKWIKFNYMLVIKAILGLSSKAKQVVIPDDMIINKGMGNFSFIKDTNIYSSRGCYSIADALRYLGFKVKIKPVPKVDIWHATYFTPLRISGAAKITTIHDLVPLRLPHATINDKGIFVQQIRDAIKNSQLIICVSEQTKSDMLSFFNIRPEKLFVTYEPVMIKNQLTDKENIISKLKFYNLQYERYILFVGAIEPKKNIKRLLEAYLTLDIDLPLVIAGKKAWLWKEELSLLEAAWNQERFRNRIRLLEYVPPSDIAVLYKGALCLTFPSLYEGFGLPPLEAMTLGCPVVTSSTSSLPEICGDAALYADPYNSKEIADKIYQLVSDSKQRDELVKKGYERAEFFSMENYKKRLLEAYSKI